MKTLVFTSPDGTNKVEVKVDIFATNTQLATAGFDTRFTNMEIVEDEAAVIAGIALTEIEKSWQGMIALAKQWGYALSAIDINEDATTAAVAVSALTGTLAGTAGANAIVGTGSNFDPELSSGDLINVGGFTYTVDVVTDDTNITVVEDLQNTFTGATGYLVE